MFLRRKESESIQLLSLCVFYYQNFYLFILHPVIPSSRNATPLKEGNLLKNFLLPAVASTGSANEVENFNDFFWRFSLPRVLKDVKIFKIDGLI